MSAFLEIAGFIASLAAMFGLIYVLEHGVADSAAAAGRVVRAFLNALRRP